MTDHRHMGQKPHRGRTSLPRLRRGGFALACAVVAVPLLSGCGTPLAQAPTTLHGVRDAQVVHSDGSTVAGTEGLRLRPGDVVRTGAAGRAELHTRGRVVYEGSAASVLVVNGAQEDLRHGAVVVDAQQGPGLTLTVAGLTSYTARGAAARAERAVTTRIAALAGRTSVDNAGGRHLDVDALTQTIVGGDALPDTTAGTPLRLTDDDGEAHAVPALVRDDLALQALAAGIDSTGGNAAQLVSAGWHGTLTALPTGVARSEQVLPIVIAAAAGGDGTAHYRHAVDLRSEGASWGVVADRLGVTADRVLAALQVFERGAASGAVGSVPSALQYLAAHGGGGTTQATPGAGNGGAGRGGSGSGRGGSASGGSGSAGPSPGPTPSRSPSPEPVSSVVDSVLSLLPTPLPTATLPVHVPVPLPSTGLLPSVPSVPSLPVVGSVVTPVPLPTSLLH